MFFWIMIQKIYCFFGLGFFKSEINSAHFGADPSFNAVELR